ncbi:MAG: FUSC family protein [Vibrio sp.]
MPFNLDSLCLFSDKFKFAFRVALSLTLAYLIPMAMGWPQASTAATTVMLIASTGGHKESLAVGSMRIVGTVIGSIIGLVLVGSFAQDRFAYMLAVSIVVSIVFYIRKAYKKDPTLFMLTGVVILMTSNGGDANGAFLYGVDRAFMTAFGVVIYTLVSVFIFPYKGEKNLNETVLKLTAVQKDMFAFLTSVISNPDVLKDDTLKKKMHELHQAQTALNNDYDSLSKECSDISAYRKEWDHVIFYCQSITEQISLLINECQFAERNILQHVQGHEEAIKNIEQLFELAEQSWTQEQVAELNEVSVSLKDDTNIAQIEKASALSLVTAINTLQTKLVRLITTIGCIDSVTETISYNDFAPKKVSNFLLWDMENFKTAVKVFLMYWFAGGLWIYFNPPGGYQFVIFSTMYMMILSFLPLHPKLLLALFTFSFLFAVPSYIFILPHMTLGIEFALFIFTYTFVGFYLFKNPLSLLFMLGFFVMGISNPMNLNFAVLLSVMMLFYLVVFMICISYYVPFSTKPEHLFCVIQERFFRHASNLLSLTKSTFPQSLLEKLKLKIALETMNVSQIKLNVWQSKINQKYFNKTEQLQYDEFLLSCERLKNNVNSSVGMSARVKENELIDLAKKQFADLNMSELLLQATSESEPSIHQESTPFELVEDRLNDFFESLDLTQYSEQKVSEFYLFLNSQKNIYKSIVQCQSAYAGIDWDNLREKRF